MLIKATGDAIVSLARVDIVNNTGCYGIRATDNVGMNVEDSTFTANLAKEGTGVKLVGKARANITRCKFSGQPSLSSGFVDGSDHAGSIVIADSVVAGDTAVFSPWSPSNVQVTNVNITDVTGPFYTTRFHSPDPDAGDRPAFRVGGQTVFVDVHINGHDACDRERMRDACPTLSSDTVILCENKLAATAVSAHGSNSGYDDVCTDPNKARYLAVVYALFGMALISILVGACILKPCSSAGSQSKTIAHLQLWLEKPLVRQGLMVMRILSVGLDIASDIVAVSGLIATSALIYYCMALVLPIFCCCITLHANICKAYFPPKQKVQSVPGTLWPYKLFCHCHAATPGILGVSVVGFPLAWLVLMHYPFMLLHALFPRRCFPWLHLEHYAKLFDLYGATLEAPISIVLITVGTWKGVSDDIFPEHMKTSVFLFTVITSLWHILLWVGTFSYAAVTGTVKSTLHAMFVELIKVPDERLPGASKELAMVPVPVA